MRKINITKQQVKEFARTVGGYAVFGLSCLALIAPNMTDSIRTVKQLTVKADYSGTIEAILNSDMFGSYQTEAISLVKQGMSEDYYKAIIAIVNSNMFGSYQIDAIKNINNQ